MRKKNRKKRNILILSLLYLISMNLFCKEIKCDSLYDEETGFIDLNNLDRAYAFEEGLACIFFSTNGESYKGFLDENGNLLFYMPGDSGEFEYTSDFDKGYTWFQYEGYFYVVDTKGNIKSKYDTENVECYGAGYTWIRTEGGENWDNAGEVVYTFYDPEGNVVLEQKLNKSDDWDAIDSLNHAYLGEGMFAYEKETDASCVIYDTNLSKTIESKASYDKVADAGCYDGIIATTVWAVGDDYWASENNPFELVLVMDGEQKEIQIPAEYMGEYDDHAVLLDWSGRYALFLFNENDEQALFAYDIQNQTFQIYTGKYKDYLEDYYYETSYVYGNVLIFNIYGDDDEKYICLVNAETMEEIGDPIREDELLIGDKALVTFTNSGTEVYDMKNNLLLSLYDEETVEAIGKNVLVVAEENEVECLYKYIRFNGKKMFKNINTSAARNVVEDSLYDDFESEERLISSANTCEKIKITVNGNDYGMYSLEDDQRIEIGTTNVCEIKEHMCKMVEADCPKQLCIDQKAIDESGGRIVCLPNKVVIEGLEKEGEENMIDSVV